MRLFALLSASVMAVLTLAACATVSSPTVSPLTPAPPTAAAAPWVEAAIKQPAAVLDAPSLSPGYQCHPCHFLAENQLFAVSNWPAGFIAVGVQQPPPVAIALSSSDGRSWTPVAGFPVSAGSSAVSVASDGTRTVVVGLQHSGAIVWAFEGQAWQQAPDQSDLHVDYAAGGMTSVIAFDGGFVAGGYRDDPLHGTASAAVWRSEDGLAWHLDKPPAGVFDGGRIWGLGVLSDAIIAVGTGGDPIYGPAAAWRWTRSTGWRRAAITPNDDGAIASVETTPRGLIAVGKNGRDMGADAWTSADGLTWTAIADQPAFHYYELPLRMRAVVAAPTGLLVGGWRSDAGKGSAVTWFAEDDSVWSEATWEPSFSGGQITGMAVAPDGGLAVAVGRTGYPDWNRATVWYRQPPF